MKTSNKALSLAAILLSMSYLIPGVPGFIASISTYRALATVPFNAICKRLTFSSGS